MKQIILFFLAISPFISNAQTILDKPISINAKSQDINQLLLDISELADVNIAFKPSFFEKAKPVTLTASNEKLSDVLQTCLAGTPNAGRLRQQWLWFFCADIQTRKGPITHLLLGLSIQNYRNRSDKRSNT